MSAVVIREVDGPGARRPSMRPGWGRPGRAPVPVTNMIGVVIIGLGQPRGSATSPRAEEMATTAKTACIPKAYTFVPHIGSPIRRSSRAYTTTPTSRGAWPIAWRPSHCRHHQNQAAPNGPSLRPRPAGPRAARPAGHLQQAAWGRRGLLRMPITIYLLQRQRAALAPPPRCATQQHQQLQDEGQPGARC